MPPRSASAQNLRSAWGGVFAVEWVALSCCLLFLAFFYPGELTTDSHDQMAEAGSSVITDWHSPLLTYVWRGLLRHGYGQGGMLVLQHLCYWCGALLLSGALVRAGHRRAGWAALGVALFPHFLFFNHYILKDTAHLSLMFLAVGLAVRGLISERSRRWWFAGCGLSLLVACLIRVNAAFAVAPLLVGIAWPAARLKSVRLVLAAIVLSGFLVVTVRYVNTHVLRAEPSDVEQSLQLFDLAGIHYFSGDGSVWGGAPIQTKDIAGCYSAFYWDMFGVKGACGSLRGSLGADRDGLFGPDAIAKRKVLWVNAIFNHPIAYLQHRASHFNSATFFAVPALHARFNKSIRDGTRAGRAAFTERDLKFDYIKKSFIIWPVNWLVLGAGVMALLWPAVRIDRQAQVAMALLASGLGYGLAYAVIGVATDVRYFLWTNLAVLLAMVLGWPALQQSWRDARWRSATLALVLISVTGIGLAARLMELPFT